MDQVLSLVKSHSALIAVSAGPLALSMVARTLFGSSKMVQYVVRGSAAWLAIRILLGPYMQMAQDNVKYLHQITGN